MVLEAGLAADMRDRRTNLALGVHLLVTVADVQHAAAVAPEVQTHVGERYCAAFPLPGRTVKLSNRWAQQLIET